MILAANWKMYGNQLLLSNGLILSLNSHELTYCFHPQHYLHLPAFEGYDLGANIHEEDQRGLHCGELSATMLLEAKVK